MHTRIFSSLCCALVVAIALPVLADTETIVVSPNRTATSLEKVGGSITVITQEAIQKSTLTNVSEILRGVPGIDVVRSGGRGGNTSIFMRGANSEHTLVLLDGIELNNPGSPSRAFNFSDLTLENVERIEILRGPQSSLYGSDALGGVINIITKEAKDGFSMKASSEAGSFSRYVQRARIAHGSENAKLSLGVTREDEGGISAADERDGNSEDDGYENTSFTLRAKLTPSDMITVDNTFRYNKSISDLDSSGGVGGDDFNRQLSNRQIFWRSAVSADLLDGAWVPTFGFSYTNHRFDDDNAPDVTHPLDVLDSAFSGRMIKVDFLNTITLSDGVKVIAGLETEQEKASSRFMSESAFGSFDSPFGPEDARNNGYFVDVTADLLENFSTSAAIRVDDHDRYGSKVTYRISPVYQLPDSGTKFRGAVGTGFKAPSLNQLYSSFGNSDLEPEETLGWEIGVDQVALDGMVTLGGTFYRQNIDQLISFNEATFLSENIGEVDITGFELYMEAEPIDHLFFRTDYTYLDAEDQSMNNQLIRRAKNRVTVKANYIFAEDKASVGVLVKYVGKRYDNDFSAFPATRVALDSYTVVDLTGAYQITEDLRLFARVENLFNEDYQDVLGFGTYGIGGFGGVEVKL